MLWMIQRVFYGDLNDNTADVPARDLDAREHLALWPMVALMLLMGVASPIWMRAIDTAGSDLANSKAIESTVPVSDSDSEYKKYYRQYGGLDHTSSSTTTSPNAAQQGDPR
jgi:hypothetical protein